MVKEFSLKQSADLKLSENFKVKEFACKDNSDKVLIDIEQRVGTNTWLCVSLSEGKNREIRKMLESQNIGTRSLVRVRIGNVNLDDLRPGEHRDLTVREVQGLLDLCKEV